MKKWLLRAILCSIAVFTAVSCISIFKSKTPGRTLASDAEGSSAVSSLYLNERLLLEHKDQYLSKIQPIFNNRCIACHSCFNSPCQLNLTSFSGVDRGAIKDDIYDFNNIIEKTPTRLGIDVPHNSNWQAETKMWRVEKFLGKHGKNSFFPVVERKFSDKSQNLNNSVLAQMLYIKERYNGDTHDKTFASEQSRICPKNPVDASMQKSNTEIVNYAQNFPWAGMPYGFPGLTTEEASTILAWIKDGASAPDAGLQRYMEYPSRPNTIEKWENFLNGPGFNYKITARYIYEHLFLAHIYFDDMPGEFFRLIRAQCDPDSYCYELPTRRPSDDPASSKFYDAEKPGKIKYKFQKITSALVHKSHIPYGLNDDKLKKWQQIFIQQIRNEHGSFPAYGNKAGANPFTTFRAIPEKSRYQFLLDDSSFFIMTFIKGPVCRGNGALSVIDDHFWVFFLKPESDVTVQHPQYYIEAANFLSTPGFYGSSLKSIEIFKQKNSKARLIKKQYLDKYLINGFTLNDIWDGDGTNQNAVLTIYRHEDSASISRGALGEAPKTMWLLDYSIFEDIYYNLVGMYDVYGAMPHQLTSRLHMDAARFNSQDLYLSFIPTLKIEGSKYNLRERTRAQWTRDKKIDDQVPDCLILPARLCAFKTGSAGAMREKVYPYSGPEKSSDIIITDLQQPQKDLAGQILAKMPAAVLANISETINKVPESQRKSISEYNGRTYISATEIEAIFSTFAGKKGLFASFLPELTYIQIIDDMNSSNDNKYYWYTLIHNRERYNVAFLDEISRESLREWPEKDSLNILQGFVGSYANAIFSIPLSRLPEFAKNVLDLSDDESMKEIYRKFLVSRHNPHFWKYFDNMNFYAKQKGSTPYADKFEGSTTDLNRYINDRGFEQ